jgi:FkbM family methyltransferase
LEEPWRWFESSGEHKELLSRVQQLRAAVGRPLRILDIGLNIGSAPWAIERVCADCEVYGFEPLPKYFQFAQLKMPRERYPHIHLFNYAICDHIGAETIWMDTSNNVGWNTLIADEKSSTQVAVPIQCVTIDALVGRLLPSDPLHFDLIKIDTEGAEHLVLQGMRRTIEAHPTPKPLLYIEVGWGRARKDWPQELAAFQMLFDNGYQKYDMDAITGTSMHWITPTTTA